MKNFPIIIKSSNIYTEEGCINGAILINKNGKIEKIFKKGDDLPQNIVQIDYKNKNILPGIIDIHSHGYLSWSAKTIDKEEIKGLSKILPSIGVTATLATTTGWKEEEINMLHAIVDAIEEGVEGTRILGIHMEGPFFNKKRHNATPEYEVQNPTIELAKTYYKECKGYLKYMTIAPEVEGALEVIRWLSERNVIIGAGHTDATYEELCEGIKAGIKTSIHTGNAMRGIDRREVGALGAALLNKNLYCEIICDLFHLSKEMLEIMFKVKDDMSKFIMMSDSDILSGVEPGDYFAFNKNVHVHQDGRILLDDDTIAGSSKYVLYGIANLVNKLHLPMETVIPLFSLNPACILNIDNEKGSIKEGKDADIIVVDNDFNLITTYVEGKCCYQQGDEIIYNQNFSSICKKIS